jgi:multicomponent Na+:H+ antiporter subunit B
MINSFDKYSIKFLSSILLFVLTIFAFYILIFGKSTPGGGFQAGAILGSGIIMYQILNNARIISKFSLNFLTFLGVAIYISTGIASVFFGGSVFEYQVFHEKYGHIIGVMSVEAGVFFVVTTSMVRISNIMVDS